MTKAANFVEVYAATGHIRVYVQVGKAGMSLKITPDQAIRLAHGLEEAALEASGNPYDAH